MPPIEKHLKVSLEKTGKDYKDLHLWLDGDPEKKVERHDITKIYEFGKESKKNMEKRVFMNISSISTMI